MANNYILLYIDGPTADTNQITGLFRDYAHTSVGNNAWLIQTDTSARDFEQRVKGSLGDSYGIFPVVGSAAVVNGRLQEFMGRARAA